MPDPGMIWILPNVLLCISDKTDKPSMAVSYPPEDRMVSKPSLMPISTDLIVLFIVSTALWRVFFRPIEWVTNCSSKSMSSSPLGKVAPNTTFCFTYRNWLVPSDPPYCKALFATELAL